MTRPTDPLLEHLAAKRSRMERVHEKGPHNRRVVHRDFSNFGDGVFDAGLVEGASGLVRSSERGETSS